MGDGGGGAALGVLDEIDADAVAPDGELLDGGGAEGVARRDEDLLAVVLEAVGELGDRGRLARAVDARDQDHGGADGAVVDLRAGVQLLAEHLLDEDLDVAIDLLVEERLADALDDL